MQLQVAQREKVKIKMSLSAPTGFGKTYGALLIAFGITKDWSKIAVIDSENQSASLYSDLGKYNTVKMDPPYTVEKFCQAIDLCVEAKIEVIIIDSTYHYWHGKGGLLEYNNSLGNNSYANWMKTNPIYSKWLDKILQTEAHFICTSRKKQAYEMTKDSNGKVTVEKKGMEDQIRDGFAYEMTIAFNIITNNHLTEVDKDRTRLFTGKPEFVITEKTGELIKQWCEQGVDVDAKVKEELTSAINGLSLATTVKDLTDFKKQLPAYIVSDASFIAAGKARYEVIMATPVTPGTTNQEAKDHVWNQA
jgi:hypothetical protein